MVFYRGFAKPIDLLSQLISRFEALADSEEIDGLMIRFSLMRLTSMLGDWVQDYPGDVSSPDIYPTLIAFYRRLLSHPATVHTAAPLQQFIETAEFAPDLDLAWSKTSDSASKPINAATSTVRRPLLLNSQGSVGKPGSITSSPLPGTSSPMAGATGLHDELEPTEPVFGLSHISEPQVPTRSTLGEPDITGRHRSASDVTSHSSNDGSANSVRGPTDSPSNVQSSAPLHPVPGPSSSKQLEAQLRSTSNGLGLADDFTIAAELTRLEWTLFSMIGPRDLLRHILVPRDQREPNGPVAKSIAHFNYISSWVGSMILIQTKAKQRARILEKFMNIAAILRRDNNYNTLQSVLAGLGNTSIHRLNQTHEAVNNKAVIKAYQSLTRLMKSDRSFAAYRLALENSTGRTIPFLGVHLQDILSISDGNPSKRESDGMVHWRKFSLMDEAVMAIVRCQQYGRAGPANPAVEKLIMDVSVMDEDVSAELGWSPSQMLTRCVPSRPYGSDPCLSSRVTLALRLVH